MYYIDMSIRNLENENKINLISGSLETGELKVKTQDDLNYINYQTPNIGTPGQVLTIGNDGTTSWTSKSGVSSGVSNPMSANLDASNFNIVNLPTIQNGGNITIFSGDTVLTTGTNANKLGIGLSTKIDIDNTTTSFVGNTIQCNNEDILGVNEIHMDNITTNITGTINSLTDIDMSNNNISSCNNLDVLNIGHTTNPTVPLNLVTNLDAGNTNNISNVNLLQCNGFDTTSITNSQGTDIFIDKNLTFINSNINNVQNLNATDTIETKNLKGVGTVFNNLNITANNTNFTSGSINGVNSIETQSISTGIISSGTATEIDFQGNTKHNLNDVLNINRLELKTLSGNGGTTMVLDSDIKCNSKNFSDISNIDVKSLGFTSGAIPMTITTDTQFNFKNLTQIQDLTALGIVNCSQLDTTNINSNTTLDINSTTKTSLSNPRLDLGTSTTKTTIHIFEASALGGTVNVAGFDFHPLNPDTAYIFHGDITLTAGLLFQNNCSVKGATISSKIIFDESTKNIQGFRATDHNVYLDSLTISGGGGHFTSSDVGLFNCQNYNTTIGTPPFYGRNKRFRVVNCNILSAYSLGIVYGYGTVNINNNFINGGGGAPTGIYTTIGLTISSGLSLEFNSNKVVLFRGAQTSSNTYMLRFINIDPLLQINAVNISGNIFHPRDSETAIQFDEGSKTALGLISANTIIRTGGVGDLIKYPNNTQFDNYNAKEILNYEIIGNAGVINGEAILQARTGIHNSLSSATFIDLDIPITSINALTKTKRFSMLFTATGVSPTSGYTAGNLIQSQTDPTKQAYIQEAITILGGTQFIWLNDMTGIFPDLLGYQEVDLSGTPTGITSTGLQIGNNSGNLEFKMIDKDPVDLQFNVQITYQNNGADDEVQFQMLKDDQGGTGYVPISQSLISHTVSRANRNDTATMCFIERFNNNETLKLEYRYIDATTTTIQSLEISAK